MTAAQREMLLKGTGDYEPVQAVFVTREYFDKLQQALEKPPTNHLYYEIMQDEPVVYDREGYYKERLDSLFPFLKEGEEEKPPFCPFFPEFWEKEEEEK